MTAELARWGYVLLDRGEATDPKEDQVQKRAIVVGNKTDEVGALDQFQLLLSRYGDRFPTVMVSCLEEVGLDDLTESLFRALHKVRVYTKSPSGEPDYDTPIVLAQGARVDDAALALHKD